MLNRRTYRVVLAVSIWLILMGPNASAQDAGLYYKNFVRHADGSFCEHAGGDATFVAYLNRDSSRVLFENAPRWEAMADPNIAGNGTFGVEIDNFHSPSPAEDDSVFVLFTCRVRGEQGILSSRIHRPWNELPQTLHLEKVDVPERPQDLQLTIDGDLRMLNWAAEADAHYLVYRRAATDTLDSGQNRMVYHLLAKVDAPPFADTTAGTEAYGYVIVPISGGRLGSRSVEATDIPTPPYSVTVAQYEVDPPSIEVSWDRSGNIVGSTFAVYRATSENGTYEQVAHVDTTYFIDLGVQAPGTYWYRIKTIGSGGSSEASTPVAVHIRTPSVDDGYQAGVYADAGVEHPSGMAWGPDGKLYVTEVAAGQIKTLHDHDGDGRVDEVSVFADGFTMPVGLAWKGDSLYVSSRGTITILRDDDRDGVADFSETIISGWEASWHQNNQLVFDEEGYFYVALGSWQDRTTGPSPYHNTIMRISPDGSDVQIWAEGIRNVYDLTFGPDGNLYGGDNGWQDQSDGPPIEELNVFMQGRHYGYPDVQGTPPDDSGTVGPIMTYASHASPTGVLFLSGSNIPEAHRDNLLMAFYGPDNWRPEFSDRAYKIIRHKLDGAAVVDTSTFAAGFYRPVDMVQDSAGTIYVADLGDLGNAAIDGRIYTIAYRDPTVIEPPEGPAPAAGLRAYPNPFMDVATVEITLPKRGRIELEVFDVLGRRVRKLVEGDFDAGLHEIQWDGSSSGGEIVASGTYVVRLRANDTVTTTVLVLAR